MAAYRKNKIQENIITNNMKYLILGGYALSLIIFGLLTDTPEKILKGLYNILTEPDTLITDYIGVGGIGASFINSGLLTLIFLFILYKLKLNINGVSIASLFLIAGFGLFGKNLLNVWFIILGVYLYAKTQKNKFSKYIYIALFGTAMGPMVTEILFSTTLSKAISIPLGAIVGISIGFILPPLSTYLLRVHQGFNLYNIGFTAGMIGTVFVSIFKSYGFLPSPRFIWTSGNNKLLSVYLFLMFFSMILLGYYLNNRSFNKVKDITTYPGRLVADFVILEGFAPTLINMGINGFIATIYILLVKGDLNGPTIGGIFTVVGFGAFGKHPKNILPIFLGVFIGSLTKIWNINDPAILLAALFGTALAPIAGEFGWHYGVIAAFIHSSVVLNVGVLHGGLNLYNNGFAAGIVAAILVPIIEAFRKDDF
ncbi:DUF1576 domain-containing protein [Paramaledivibacter caminithermalis]|jgi:hypothetical protein|uniref:DUF1576 domain-containing protein n=1 Tax=Paramaledivibacter caminithermalis (strain DSM 15212 / CIP 107654 / DViRD3) TaxID=1121301 RepID=A0A1M6K321_PARC5|nr:DUF1576 domain-containing protein [Paramaledivibacter caminithermalis]SHJ53353.1 Protein of unknown function [Paramaledivibacter caminithermalis DSM 15212]